MADYKIAQDGKKYKVGSIVRVKQTFGKHTFKPFKARVVSFENDGELIKVQPDNKDFTKLVKKEEISVVKYNA